MPLQYIPLTYLFGRALWIGMRGGGEGIRPRWPAAWLLIAALFLIGFRVGLNMADSGAIDVGYAGVVGADRIAHGEPIYDNFPEDVSQGDTYGPVNYLAYVPFERIWPWSGTWNDLPAAHGAAVFFDLATFALLIFLGRRIRPGPAGNKLAATLAFGWAAYPYTAFTLLSNSNDSLVAMLLVATLLVLAKPAARGVMAALATFAKFAPAVLAPMLAHLRRETLALRPGLRRHSSRRNALARNRPRPPHRLRAHHRLPSRPLFPLQHLGPSPSPSNLFASRILIGVAALSLLFAFRPKDKQLFQVAALGAALLIGVQLTMHHWFYLYIVWFYPLLLVAMVVRSPMSNTQEQPQAARLTRGPDHHPDLKLRCRNHHRSDRVSQPFVVDVNHRPHHPNVLIGRLELDRHLRDHLLQDQLRFHARARWSATRSCRRPR